MSTNGFIDSLGEFTQSVLAPAAELITPVAGDAAWGWAVLLVGAGWRALTWPWLVHSAQRRIQKLAQSTESDSAPITRPPRSAFGIAGTVFTLLQVALIVIIAGWSRTGPDATEASFYGLSALSTPAVFLGPSGIGWALALAVLGTAAGMLALRAAGTDDHRQRFFARYMTPVIFMSLGLFLPAAMILPFVFAMGLNLMATGWVMRRTPLRVEVAA